MLQAELEEINISVVIGAFVEQCGSHPLLSSSDDADEGGGDEGEDYAEQGDGAVGWRLDLDSIAIHNHTQEG